VIYLFPSFSGHGNCNTVTYYYHYCNDSINSQLNHSCSTMSCFQIIIQLLEILYTCHNKTLLPVYFVCINTWEFNVVFFNKPMLSPTIYSNIPIMVYKLFSLNKLVYCVDFAHLCSICIQLCLALRIVCPHGLPIVRVQQLLTTGCDV